MECDPSRRRIFCFSETERDAKLMCWSPGQGHYFNGTPAKKLYSVFQVYKDHVQPTLKIEIQGNNLVEWLHKVAPEGFPRRYYGHFGPLVRECSYLDLLPHYPALKSALIEKETLEKQLSGISAETKEIQLFVRDFLLERSIFEDFGIESLLRRKILTWEHWQDMQHRSINDDLDDLDEYVNIALKREADISNDKSHARLLFNPSIRSELRRAIQEKDYLAVESMLTIFPGFIDAKTLKIAIEFYDSSILSVLLDRGAEVNGDSFLSAQEPICFAATEGHLVAVEMLLQYGAKMDGDHSLTPLIGAASSGHLDIVQCLLRNGANINGNSLGSPLSIAAEYGQMHIVEYLISHGAEINGKSYRPCSSPISRAVENGHVRIVDYLVSHGADVDPVDFSGISLLSMAVEKGDMDIIKLLVNQGANVNPTNRGRTCPLFIAVEKGRIDIVEYLVRHGADVDGTGFCNPLCKAAKKGYFKIVEYLVEHGADINKAYYYGSAPSGLGRHMLNGIPSCPVTADIQARERHKTGSRLLMALSMSHQRLMDEISLPSASNNLRLFGDQLGPRKDIWRRGTRLIRAIMSGHLPSTILDVVSCLQVADAMRSTISDVALVCSQNEFIGDLRRWSELVLAEDQALFSEVASCLWGKSWKADQPSPNPLPLEELLLQFQELIGNLVHQSVIFARDELESSQGGYRLRSLRQQAFPITRDVSQDCSNGVRTGEPPLLEKGEIWKDGLNKSVMQTQDPEKHLDVLKWVTVLMAGAIFGVILLYLCLLRYHSSSRLQSVKIHYSQGLNSNQILARNCTMLMLYLGISTTCPMLDDCEDNRNESSESYSSGDGNGTAAQTSAFEDSQSPPNPIQGTFSSQSESVAESYTPVEAVTSTFSPDFTTSATASSKVRCPKCRKGFSTVTNRNKHIRNDCKNVWHEGFPCRNPGCCHGPQGPFTRKAYRDKHEKLFCKVTLMVNRSKHCNPRAQALKRESREILDVGSVDDNDIAILFPDEEISVFCIPV